MRGKRFKSVNEKYFEKNKIFLMQCSYLDLLGKNNIVVEIGVWEWG